MPQPFTSVETPFQGARLLEPFVFRDERGEFTKTYHQDFFTQMGLPFVPKEEFISVSQKGVLRGMHFQVPPCDCNKVVYCISGCVLDVLLDIRSSSGTFGKCYATEISSDNRRILFAPQGMAHGFIVLSTEATMVYKTDHVYSADHDAGIRWDSFGFPWPCAAPVLSRRDQRHPSFNEFISPFA
jgi:dTDP-4-dehydrorhamnose 3,5-epimerase